MRRTKLIALLLVVTMAVATIPAMAAKEAQSSPAPVVGAYRTPTLSAICIPTYPSRYQTYTVYGWLKWSGIPLPYKYVKVYYHFPGQSTWHYLKSVQTNANGRYSFSSNSGAQAVYWMIKFAGDSVYYPKTGYITVHVTPSIHPTKLALTAPPQAIACKSFTLSGRLTANGRGVPNQPVMLYRSWFSGVPPIRWFHVSTVTTNANGWYAATDALEMIPGYHYLATYAGNGAYAGCSAYTYVEIEFLTRVTLTTSTTVTTVNQPVTFNATLYWQNCLSNGNEWIRLNNVLPVKIWHYYNGVRYADVTTTTNTSGEATFTQTFKTPGTRYYYATFEALDYFNGSKSAVVTISVH